MDHMKLYNSLYGIPGRYKVRGETPRSATSMPAWSIVIQARVGIFLRFIVSASFVVFLGKHWAVLFVKDIGFAYGIRDQDAIIYEWGGAILFILFYFYFYLA